MSALRREEILLLFVGRMLRNRGEEMISEDEIKGYLAATIATDPRFPKVYDLESLSRKSGHFEMDRDLLASNGLVELEEEETDRRRIYWRLSEAGWRRFEELVEEGGEEVRRILEAVDMRIPPPLA